MGILDRVLTRLVPACYRRDLAIALHERTVAALRAKRDPTENDKQRSRAYEARIREWKRE